MSADNSNVRGRKGGSVTNATFNMPKHNWCRIKNTSLIAGTIQYYNQQTATCIETLAAGEFITWSTEDVCWDKLDVIAPAGCTIEYFFG